MSLSAAKVIKVLRNHYDSIPLLADAAVKYAAAKNAVEVVDAVVPAEYKIAAIIDDYNAPSTQGVGDDDLVAAAARFCEAYNSAPPAFPADGTEPVVPPVEFPVDGTEPVVRSQALLTPGTLQGIVSLITLLAPLLMKR